MPDQPDHYFSSNPDAPSQPASFRAEVRGFTLGLTSDAGTFSHGRIDSGSRLLAEKMQLGSARDILDLGCGWGILGIMAARITPDAHVVMVDVNPRACELAVANAAANGAANVEVLCGDAPEALGERTFDAVITNPPIRAGKAGLMRLLADAAGRLREGGSLWLVIRTDKGAKSLTRDLGQWFASVQTVEMRAGYRIVHCHR
jgi:16S rRNA (guanine1207-N2)-methyltransferase